MSGLALGGAVMSASALAQGIAAKATADLSFVHPELRATATMLLQMPGAGAELNEASLKVSRNEIAGMLPPPLPGPAYSRQSIAAPAGAPDVPL